MGRVSPCSPRSTEGPEPHPPESPLSQADVSQRQTLVFDDNHLAAALYGDRERTLRILEQDLGIQVRARGNEVRLIGSAERVRMGRKVLEELYGVLRQGGELSARDIRAAVRMVVADQTTAPNQDIHHRRDGQVAVTPKAETTE